MLSAKNLSITFNAGTPIETRALRGLSLDIPAGQFVTVIGSNGAGKSTFLNAVSGDLPIDSGTIAIDNQDVTRQPVWERAKRSEEHTSELQSLMRISYAVFCLKKKKKNKKKQKTQ